jgi:murein DD-endopeptidase MepM/ murein hydrolase activator NlpD
MIAAEPRCPSVDRAERPQFSHPHAGEIITHFASKPVNSKGWLNSDIGYAATAGDPVRAASDGQVSDVQLQRDGSGQRLTVRHAQGFATAYAPMSEIAVQINDCVSAGDVLGRVGATGAGASLHFEVMIHGRLVDLVRMRGGLPAR